MIQEQIRIRELEAALEANRTLLALESKKVHSVQSQLISIGQELGGEQFDQFMKNHLENDLTTEALAAEIIGLVKARLGLSGSPPGTQTTRVRQVEAETAEKKQAAALEQSLLKAHQRIQELEASVQDSQKLPADGDYPAWSKPRQKQIDLQTTPSAADNTSPSKTYRTDRQTSLVLRTAEQFTQLGYAVDGKPEGIRIDSERGFQPDLVVSRQDETFYLLVETGQADDRLSLMQKWEKASLAGGGRIWVVTGQLASMNSLQSQVVHWATQNGKTCRLYITNTEFLKLVRPGESPWARIREL